MLTLAALVTLCLSGWGACEILLDLRHDRSLQRIPTAQTRIADYFWLVACGCMGATAAHSLAASWF